MDFKPWYDSLAKPAWTPPPSTIGLIWSLLYPVIFSVNGFVYYKAFRRELPWQIVVPFALNLILNLLFTPIQFGLRNLPLASLVILLILATIIWCMAIAYRHAPWITYAYIPYLLWVSIATVLQISISVMNL